MSSPKKTLACLGIVLVALFPAAAHAQLTPFEHKALDGALYLANLSESDLRFERKQIDDPYRMPLAALALDDPLAGAERLTKLHSRANESLAQDLRYACAAGFQSPEDGTQELPSLGPIPKSVPEDLHEPVEVILGAIAESTQAVHRAIVKLSPAERRELVEGLPLLCAGTTLAHFSFTQKTTVSRERLLSLLEKVDLAAIRTAGVRLSECVESQIPELKRLSKYAHLSHSVRFEVNSYRVEISSDDDVTHTSRDSNLFIALGDRNRFTGRFGAGIGYCSVLVDLGRQSYYDVPDLSIGVGVLGVGLAYANGDGDVFRGGSACFGAGLAGVGGMSHGGTDSIFQANTLSEGFGAFGMGLLVDAGDRDSLRGETFTQGAARTQGVGWLIERGSEVSLTARGLAKIETKNAAISCSQGFSSGFGSEGSILSGGIALVTTIGRDERYVGGLRCQGAALWGGLGSISDAGEGCTHSCCQEAQSYANHQAGSYVFESGGFGSYSANFGTCHGCASDCSVAMVVERGSQDVFSSTEGRPASASDSSVAVFLNSGAENRFSFANPTRHGAALVGGLALFCDAGSNAAYVGRLSSPNLLVTGDLEIQYRSPSDQVDDGALIAKPGHPQSPPITSQILPNPGDAEIAAMWRSALDSGPNTNQVLAHLAAIGEPAVDFVLKSELDKTDGSTLRAVANLISLAGNIGRRRLAIEIKSDNLWRAANALRVACLAPGPGADDAIVASISNSAVARLSAKAAGLCHVEAAVSRLLPLCASTDQVLALNSMIALGQIGDRTACGTAAACLASQPWPMKRAAMALLSKFPEEAIVAASGLLASSSPADQRTAVQLLARLNTPEGWRRVGKLLDSGSADVQVEALLALQGRVPEDLKGKVADLQQSKDAMVRRLAEGMPVDR